MEMHKSAEMFGSLDRDETKEFMDRIGRSVKVTGRLSRAILDLPGDTTRAAMIYMYLQRELGNLHTEIFNVRNVQIIGR
jgi:hypothetical protein